MIGKVRSDGRWRVADRSLDEKRRYVTPDRRLAEIVVFRFYLERVGPVCS